MLQADQPAFRTQRHEKFLSWPWGWGLAKKKHLKITHLYDDLDIVRATKFA